MINSLDAFLVFSNYQIDINNTLIKFNEKLSSLIEQETTDNNNMLTAINAVFDELNGTHIKLPELTCLALAKLNVVPEQFVFMGNKVKNFIRTSPHFLVSRGRGGGVVRATESK